MTSANGSGFALNPRSHLGRGRVSAGVRGELELMRKRLVAQFAGSPILYSQEYTNPAAADVDAHVLAVTPPESGDGELVYELGSATPLDGVVASATMPFGRNVTVTTVGADDQFAFPFDVVVEGLRDGVAQTETITVASGASPGTVVGAKIFDRVTKVTIPEASAAAGAGTVSVGFGSRLGLVKAPVTRAGLVNVTREVVAGAVVTNGVFSDTNRSYTPNTIPNGSNDYYIIYEIEAPTVVVDRLAVRPEPGEQLGQHLLALPSKRSRPALKLVDDLFLFRAEVVRVRQSSTQQACMVQSRQGLRLRGLRRERGLERQGRQLDGGQRQAGQGGRGQAC